MLERKAYSRCLRACLLTDTDLYSMLRSGNNHSQENEENQTFEPIQTFDNNEDVVGFVHDGNIFDCLDNNKQFFEKDDSNISRVLIEKLKSNSDDNDGLLLLNEEAVEVLRKLYESFEKQEFSLDEVCNHPVKRSTGEIVSNLKFVQDVI